MQQLRAQGGPDNAATAIWVTAAAEMGGSVEESDDSKIIVLQQAQCSANEASHRSGTVSSPHMAHTLNVYPNPYPLVHAYALIKLVPPRDHMPGSISNPCVPCSCVQRRVKGRMAA